jgi:hypothetical protein
MHGIRLSVTDHNHTEDLIDFEDLASKHYTVESVWGTPPPKPSSPGRHRRSTQSFVVEVKRSRGNSTNTAPDKKSTTHQTAESFFKPKF